jgi:two-component system sensor histidine kinase KdpD
MKDEHERCFIMQNIERIPTLEGSARIQWRRVFVELLLALASTLLITWLIDIYQLYPRIPNISIVYLLPVLLLAVTFGRLGAVVAALAAFLAFDFFLVPPFYTFIIDRPEDWIALCIFLITALLTSQLAEVMRQRNAEARLREREARILYEVIRIVNLQEQFEDQLTVIALAMRRVFASWGIDECALLLPDEQGNLSLHIDSSMDIEDVKLAPEELATALSVLKQGDIREMRIGPASQVSDDGIMHYQQVGPVTTTRFLPLKIGEQIVAVLCLHLQHAAPWFSSIASMQEEQQHTNNHMEFFQTFLEEATSLIERAQLRSLVRSQQR